MSTFVKYVSCVEDCCLSGFNTNYVPKYSTQNCPHFTSWLFYTMHDMLFTCRQDRKCKYSVILRRVSATIVAVENQYVLHIVSVCL
jgi:hypothetical protein